MDTVWTIGFGFWNALAEMAPYLLFGFLFAGALSVMISPTMVERHLGGRGMGPVLKAALFGIPLPLCSCGVIPVAASLRRHGASRGATTSFLLSTPQTGVDSILVTYSLLGPVFAVFRPLAALVSGLIGGAIVAVVGSGSNGQASTDESACQEACCSDAKAGHLLTRILTYGFVTLPRDIGKALLIGLLIAGVISAAVPDDYFAGLLGGGIATMFVMMLVGLPVYVCATASVPVAAALVAKGVSPGAALVFLMTGPATNAAAIATVWRVMGGRTALVYLGVVAVSALGCGVALDQIMGVAGSATVGPGIEMLPGWLGTVSAVILLGVVAAAIWRPVRTVPEEPASDGPADRAVTLTIGGMTCSHCVQSVERALRASPGVESVDVRLSSGRARVGGVGYKEESLREAIEGLGFSVGVATGPSTNR